MRRFFALTAAVLIAATAAPHAAEAQSRGGDAERQRAEKERKKEQAKKEWSTAMQPLPGVRNAGPCPFVKVLYDAARYVEFKDQREAASNVVWSGEIDGLSAGCRYREDDPIDLDVDVLFSLGKGPQAQGDRQTFRYWVAVTDRNRMVIAKEYFDFEARFPKGADRTTVTEKLRGIVIPRASMTTSGSVFEVLVGFDVTPQMAQFNRDGKRFRVNAGAPAAGQ